MRQAMSGLVLVDADATRRLGACLGETAVDALTLALDGELGSGKTTLTQGLARALGVEGRVTSPTFQLLFVHEGRLTLHHADLYRLGDESELTELGFDEVLGRFGVSVIEWANRFPQILGEDYLHVEIVYEGEGRCAELKAHGERSSAWRDRAMELWARSP